MGAFTIVPVVAAVVSISDDLGTKFFLGGYKLCTISSKIVVHSVKSPSFLILHLIAWDSSTGHLLKI